MSKSNQEESNLEFPELNSEEISNIARDLEFSELTSEEITNLAKDYLDSKQELEKSINSINSVKIGVIVGSALITLVLASPLSTTAVILAPALATLGIDTASLAEKWNKWRKKRRITEDP
jgi:hypothetical protein